MKGSIARETFIFLTAKLYIVLVSNLIRLKASEVCSVKEFFLWYYIFGLGLIFCFVLE